MKGNKKGKWRSLGEGGDPGGDNWMDKDNFEEHGKLGIPMIQKQKQQRKVLATNHPSVLPSKLKRHLFLYITEICNSKIFGWLKFDKSMSIHQICTKFSQCQNSLCRE